MFIGEIARTDRRARRSKSESLHQPILRPTQENGKMIISTESIETRPVSDVSPRFDHFASLLRGLRIADKRPYPSALRETELPTEIGCIEFYDAESGQLLSTLEHRPADRPITAFDAAEAMWMHPDHVGDVWARTELRGVKSGAIEFAIHIEPPTSAA
jgi:hypothetical protein